MRSIFMITLIFAACQVSAQKQGICGKIFWIEGNQMPGPGMKTSGKKGTAREIHIYEPVNFQQAVQVNGFYKDIKTKLVAKAQSQPDGSFKIKLPPGTYSVFTKEPEGLFGNTFDQNGVINSVTVIAGKFTKTDIIINYKAAY